MKYSKNYLIYLWALLLFSFPILSAQFSKEEIHEGKTESSTPNPTPNIDSLIPNKSPIPNTWGVSEKEMEEAFEENEHLVCLMVFGKNFKRLNNRWKEVLGWEIEELLNTPYYDFIHPDDMEKTLDYEKHFIPTGFVNRYRSKDGSYRWFSWIGLSNLNEELEGVSSFAIVLDITLDEILKKERQTQIQILNEHTSLQTRVIKSIVEIQKLYLGELGQYDDNKSEPFSFQHILCHFLNLSGSDFGFMGLVLSENGGKELSLETWEPGPSLIGEGKKFFELLRSSEKTPIFFKDILDRVLDEGKQVVINDVEAYLRDKGYPEHFPYFKSFLGVPLRSTNGPIGVLALVNREHGYNDLLLEWFEPLFLLSGRIVNEVKLLRFQEEAKKQTREKEKAEAKNEAKSAFLAHMSHELRTPLSGLIGILDLLNKEHVSPEGLNYLQMAKDTSASLLDILNDILDLSKIEVNKLTLEEIEFNPLLVTKDVVRLLSFSAKKKNLSLKLTADSDIPDNLIGDPTRVRQILMNIVGNAIKFTEKGSVKVLLDGKMDEDKKFNYILSATIKDTGIGISHDNLQNLFQPFFQAEESMSRRFGGTGLGLYITKCLCELMGGSINIKSTEGKGSKFHFEINLLFPKKMPEAKPIYYSDTPDILPPLNVLVVEDNPLIQLVTKTMLERSGCSVTIANNGTQSLEALSKENTYDLVIMDGEMPGMNGLEATRLIRQSYGFYDLPIIALTAHAMLSDKQKFLEAGMNGYLTKPVNKKELNTEILRCLRERREHQPARGSSSHL